MINAKYRSGVKEGDGWEDEDNCGKERERERDTELEGQSREMISLMEDMQGQKGAREPSTGGREAKEDRETGRLKRRKEEEASQQAFLQGELSLSVRRAAEPSSSS